MVMSINTNVNSLNAQRNTLNTQNSLATSMQRLSSGLRVNSARDDAAGLAIADRMNTQVRGMNVAIRNANDGISLAQTAEGALSEIGNNLQRIRELAVQSANATNSASDRAALQLEVSQLVSEIDRVASQTQFNGLNLLDGSFRAQQFQIGANAGQTIRVDSIGSARTTDLGVSFSATRTGIAVTEALTADALRLNDVAVQASVDGSANGQTADSAFAIARAINASGTGVTASANPTTVTGAAITTNGAIAAGAFSINGIEIGAIEAGADPARQADNVTAAINAISAATGVTATNTANTITLSAADGRNIAITGTVANLANTGLTAAVTRGTLTLTSEGRASITVAGAAPVSAGLTPETTPASATGTAVSLLNIGTVAGANTAITSVDAALGAINTSRADLGAIQNRFGSVIQNLQTSSENLSAARGRILDADFAAETANLSRAQILQQAGTAMIAQANQLPQGVLALLR